MGERPNGRFSRLSCLLALWALGCGASPGGAKALAPSATAPADDGAAPRSVDGEPGGPTPTSADATATGGTGTGPKAVDFELERLDGGSFRLSERLGKDVILIDFWATYCEPCLAAMPHLNELYVRHKEQGLLILGVSIDGPGSTSEIHSTVARLGVQFPILLDADSRVVSQYNPRVSAPYSVLIGRDGRVIARQEGYTSGKGEALKENIERALGAAP